MQANCVISNLLISPAVLRIDNCTVTNANENKEYLLIRVDLLAFLFLHTCEDKSWIMVVRKSSGIF